MLTALRRGWRVLLATTVLGAALGAGLVAGTSPRYRADAQLFAALLARPDQSTQLYVQSKVMSYAALVSSEELASRVVRATGVRVGAGTVAGELTGTASGQTLTVTVEDPSRARALTLARAASSLLPALITEIDFADAPTPLITLRQTTPARVSSQPVSPNRTRIIALGVLAGLAIGTGVLALQAVLGNRVRDLADLGDVTVLAAVPDDAPAADDHSAPSVCPRGEAVRQLRTAVDFLLPDLLPPVVVVVTSPAGRAGVTALVRDLATAFAESGRRVAVVDAHLRRPQDAWIDGTGLTDVLFGGAALDDALHAVPLPDAVGAGRVTVLPAGAPAPAASVSLAIGSGEVDGVLGRLAAAHDLVLVDAPAVLDTADTAWICAQGGAAVVVVPAGVATTAQVARARRALQTVGTRVLGAVLTGAAVADDRRRPSRAPIAP